MTNNCIELQQQGMDANGKAFKDKDESVTSATKDNGTALSAAKWTSESLVGPADLCGCSRNMCDVKKSAQRHFPFLKWGATYRWEDLLCDVVAGLTVGLTAIPQGIAYATIAGLPPQYGLYSCIMGCFVYIVFGSWKDITIGPTTIMAIMTQEHVLHYGEDMAVFLCFVTGCVIFIMGVLHLGFLINFISSPVSFGFTAAAAITIASTQVKGLLGLSFSSEGFLDTWIKVFENIKETRLWDTILGFCCIVALAILRKLKDASVIFPEEKEKLTKSTIFARKALWYISLGRNALVVLACTLVAYAFSTQNLQPFKLTGHVEEGFPPFRPPPFSLSHNNETIYFGDMLKGLGSSTLLVPLLAVLESVAIAKSFAKGKPVDATQEMIALGMSNILGSFVRSFPATGSFSRTAINNASGVRTPLGGLFTGLLVLLSLGVLTSSFFYIPKATLSSVIIMAVVFMVEFEVVRFTWNSKKLDLIPLVVTFVSCLFISLEYGILIGVGAHLLLLLYPIARPSVDVERFSNSSGMQFLLFTPQSSINFPSAEYLSELVQENIRTEGSDIIVVVNGKHISDADATAIKQITMLFEDFKKRKQTLLLWNWKPHLSERFLETSEDLFVTAESDDSIDHLITSHLLRQNYLFRRYGATDETLQRRPSASSVVSDDSAMSMSPENNARIQNIVAGTDLNAVIVSYDQRDGENSGS